MAQVNANREGEPGFPTMSDSKPLHLYVSPQKIESHLYFHLVLPLESKHFINF